jgi:acyl carrier protein
MNPSTTHVILEVVAGALDTEPGDIGNNSGLYRTLGWDSLAHLRIVAALESRFDVRFSESQIETSITIPDLIDALNGLMEGASDE